MTSNVFAFQGAHARFANALFSSKDTARTWIRKHGLTGLLTGYVIDSPAFDSRLLKGTLPRNYLDAVADDRLLAAHIEMYVDGTDHEHYFLGFGPDDREYEQAQQNWDRQEEARLRNQR